MVDLINAGNGRIASRCWRCYPQCWHHSTLHHLLKTNILFVEMKWINLLFIGFFSMIVQRVSTWLHMQQELAHMRTNLCWGGAGRNWIRLVEPHYLRIFATTLQYFCNFIRDGICQCRHCQRQCKIFASGVNFSRNNAIYNIDDSTKYISSQ